MKKFNFTSNYLKLIKKAAVLAKQEGVALIERRHLWIALCAMNVKLINRLLGCQRFFHPEDSLVKKVSDLENSDCEVAFSRESYQTLSLFGGVLGGVMESSGAEDVDLRHIAAALLLDDSNKSPIRELLNVNGISVDKVNVLNALKNMEKNAAKKHGEVRKIYRSVEKVRKQMSDGIVGQGTAISKICDSLLGNWLLPPGERTTPLVFTIVGRSGSGKSLVANILSDAIAQSCEGSVTVLNGGIFASENTSHDVIGYDSSWKGGARIGTFTGPVIDNPAAIIVIDCFELLHPIARSHIMRAITTGHLKDDMAGREVSFRKTTIILLSSAGCDGAYFDDASADKTRTRIVEELTSGISDQNHRDNVTSFAGVSNEVVMLRELAVDELRQVFVRTIEVEISSIKKSIAKKIDIDANRLANVLIEGVTSLNPSEVAPMVKATIGDPIRKTIMEANGAGVKSIVVEIDSDGEIDVNSVSSNLAMRKRRLISVTSALDKARLVLTIKSGDYVLLPAVRDGIIKIEPPKAGDSFDKLVGLDTAIAYARRWVDYFENKSSIRPNGIILEGGAGSGKTSFVRSLAAESKRPYAVLNCSELSSADAIMNAFNAFRRYGKHGLIVFLEEIDACAGDRDDDKTPAYIERLNLLLEQIDGFNNDPQSKIMYIGATNRLGSLDSAIMRDGRLGHVIHFRGLNAEGRRKLLTMEMAECGLNLDRNPKLLEFMVRTTENMSGAMLKAIVRELAMSVLELKQVTREMYVKARRVVVAGESTTTIKLTEDQLMSVAYHEGGHAIVCDMVGRDFVQATIVEDDSSRLGYVESSDKKSCTGTAILSDIDIALAGRAGQEVMGLPTSGVESDLECAKELAYKYIRNGFCREWGLLYLEEPDEKMKTLASKILDERYAEVTKMLIASKSLLNQFAKMLVERRTVFHDDLLMLKKSLDNKGTEYGNDV